MDLLKLFMGKGSFISARNIELQKIETYKEVEDLAKKIVKKIQSSSISIDDLIDLIKKIYEEGQ